jgi:N-acetylmuramoyl-L-alanine amidase
MNYKPLRPEDVKFIVVHCSATRPSSDIGKAEITRMHLERGFFEIGYHAVIRRDGRVEEGRAIDKPGAHAAGFNQKSVALCMVGGVTENDIKVPENNFTPAQFASMRKVVAEWQRMFPHAKVLGHRDLPADKPIPKACPCFDVSAYFQANPICPTCKR